MSIFRVEVYMHGVIEVEAANARRATEITDAVTTLAVESIPLRAGESASVFSRELDSAGNHEDETGRIVS